MSNIETKEKYEINLKSDPNLQSEITIDTLQKNVNELISSWKNLDVSNISKENAMKCKNYRERNLFLQKKALAEGKKLNKLCKDLDPNFEDIIIGHCHKASGILIYKICHYYDPIKAQQIRFLKLLMVREEGKFNIPGGKTTGEEYPLKTAVREFNEEITLPQFRLGDYLLDWIIPQYHYPGGSYTLFFVNADDLYEKDVLLQQLQDFAPERNPITPSESIPCWVDARTVIGLYQTLSSKYLEYNQPDNADSDHPDNIDKTYGDNTPFLNVLLKLEPVQNWMVDVLFQ